MKGRQFAAGDGTVLLALAASEMTRNRADCVSIKPAPFVASFAFVVQCYTGLRARPFTFLLRLGFIRYCKMRSEDKLWSIRERNIHLRDLIEGVTLFFSGH